MAVIDHTSSFRRRIWNFFFLLCGRVYFTLSISDEWRDEELRRGTVIFGYIGVRGSGDSRSERWIRRRNVVLGGLCFLIFFLLGVLCCVCVMSETVR